jgi:integrase
METTERIDIHQISMKIRRELLRLTNDTELLPPQRAALLRFISDARTGRLHRRGAGRRLSDGRCLKIITTLRRFAVAVRVPFEAVTPEQMQEFVLGVEDGTVHKLIRLLDNERYSPDSVLDFKKILRRFYAWLVGENSARFQDLVGWFDMREVRPELKTFGLDAAQRLARAVGVPQGQALIWAAFDGGFRAGELFNLRLRDITFVPDALGRPTCLARIRVSKTLPRTISLPIATDAIRFWIERHPQGGPVGADGIVRAKDPEAQLITWSYHYCRKILHQTAKVELPGDRMYFHRFRHASATMYARHLNAYQLCARYGWAMGSKAVQRYIDHSGVLAQDTAVVIRKALEEQGTARPATTAWPAQMPIERGPGGPLN